MLCFPNAKINIGLNILRKRPDGYHDIETLFCPLVLHDLLEFVENPSLQPGQCNLAVSGADISGDDVQNLVVRAYQMLAGSHHLPGVDIYLHKLIPMGAGLGGGSSDGAYMLRALNDWFRLQISTEALMEYAIRLGSDCPFFLVNRPVIGQGRGNEFREIALPPFSGEVLLVNPGIHIGTALAYGGIHPRVPDSGLGELLQQPVPEWKHKVRNDFEDHVVALHPVIGHIKNTLYEMGAVYASMSGSGSSVYGLFNGKAPQVASDFQGMFCHAASLTF